MASVSTSLVALYSSWYYSSLQDSDSDDDDNDGSVKWGEDDSSSSSEDEDDKAYSQLKGRARWLKRNTVTKEKVVKDKEGRSKLRAAEKAAAAAAAAAAAEAMTATKSILPEEGLTPSIINRRVQELAAQRGRKGKDHRQLLRELEAISRLALQFGPRIEIPILMYVISAQFGLQRTLDDYMDTATWKSCANYLERIANVLDEGYVLGVENVDSSDLLMTGPSKNMKSAAAAGISSTTPDHEASAISAMAAGEKLINPETGEVETPDERAERIRLDKEEAMSDEEKKRILVVGSLSLHLSRLEEEYTKSLQKISHHSGEYIVRLRDESKLVRLLARFQSYYEARAAAPPSTVIGEDIKTATAAAAQLAQLRIEHIYYRHDTIAKQVDKAALFYERYGEGSMLHPSCIVATTASETADFSCIHPGAYFGKPALDEADQVLADSINFTELMSKLCNYVYRHGTEKAKTRSIICQVYHHALHDRFLEARDLLLMSHVQETIYVGADVGTMILFNRMMVTLGMCAFRAGRINDSHQCLSDICSGRVRELLAQGMNTSRFNDKSAEQEKAEKRRLVPYHQHINLDLLEACHLISAMLLEVPNMAGNYGIDGETGNHRRHRVISRTFRKFHDQYNHQVFTGPPEQTRDFVMRAAKSLMKGDWKKCVTYLANLDVWALVPSDMTGVSAKDQIATMLTNKIKLEGLRTYLYAFAAQYDSLSLSQLCGMFEMSKNEVHSVVSKMMINRDLYASWDQPTETIVLRKVEPSNLQILAYQFAEKTAALVEANERLLDAQHGNFGYKDEHWKSGGGGDRDDRWAGNDRDGRGGGKRDGGDRGDRGGYRNNRDGGDRGNRYNNDNRRGGGGDRDRGSGGRRDGRSGGTGSNRNSNNNNNSSTNRRDNNKSGSSGRGPSSRGAGNSNNNNSTSSGRAGSRGRGGGNVGSTGGTMGGGIRSGGASFGSRNNNTTGGSSYSNNNNNNAGTRTRMGETGTNSRRF
jgi:translation initiation factor 3 subunit C